MKEMNPDIVVDVRDLIAPVSLLMVENRIAEMQKDQVAEVLCSDKDTKEDLLAIVRNSTLRCIHIHESSDHVQLLIKKEG